jgi:hypothetical protein
MDWVSFTSWTSAQLIFAQQRGEDLAPLLAHHNRVFPESYARWFQGIYKDKYEYLGDFELMSIAFQMDISLYYMGVAAQPFKRGHEALNEPVYSTKPSIPVFYFMRGYNRRLAQIARARRRRGTWGRANNGRRKLVSGFTFSPKSMTGFVGAMARWAVLEVREGWRSWFAPRPKTAQPMQAAATAQTSS